MCPNESGAAGNDRQLRMFVLDVLRHDIETVTSIVKLLNNEGCIGWRGFWPHDFTEEEVGRALENLVNLGMVQELVYNESLGGLREIDPPRPIGLSVQSLWFRLTNAGREAWDRWTPPGEPE